MSSVAPSVLTRQLLLKQPFSFFASLYLRLVNISTHLGGLSQLSEELQKKFSSPTLSEESLVNLMNQFVQ